MQRSLRLHCVMLLFLQALPALSFHTAIIPGYLTRNPQLFSTGISSNSEKAKSENQVSRSDPFLNSELSPHPPHRKSPRRISSLSRRISSLFQANAKQFSERGIGFVLSYAVLSTLNGAVNFSCAWYMSVKEVWGHRLCYCCPVYGINLTPCLLSDRQGSPPLLRGSGSTFLRAMEQFTDS